jgi:two-component system chemotaxis response regulator CheY
MALRDQLRVLVVDDMSTSRGLIAQALDAMGVRQVTTTDGGPGALQILAKNPVHLVISDFNMPQMNGLQLLHALRVGARTKGVGFILITGKADREIIEGGKRLGMNNFLKKPFQVPELKACIETVVGTL